MIVYKLREENIVTGEVKYSLMTHLKFLILLACRIGNLSERDKFYIIEEEKI